MLMGGRSIAWIILSSPYSALNEELNDNWQIPSLATVRRVKLNVYGINWDNSCGIVVCLYQNKLQSYNC